MSAHKDSHITLKWQETAPELHGAEAAAAITEAFVRLLSSQEAVLIMTNKYVIYDERALRQPTDDCSVLEACSSLNEVRGTTWDGRRDPLGVVAEYDVVAREGKNWLENERILGTVPQVKAAGQLRGKSSRAKR